MDPENAVVPPEPGERKAVKLAEAEENIEGLLLPLFGEMEDSGIDSDSTELLASSARHEREERNANLSDASSSDEDPFGRQWWQGVNNNKFVPKDKDDDIFKAMEDGRINPLEVQWPMGHRLPSLRQFTFEDSRPEPRASPPLYEVELTASEEDDDASVLELVIPMQSSRYKRVPTSSPKKPKLKPKPKVNRTFYYSFICCMRK